MNIQNVLICIAAGILLGCAAIAVSYYGIDQGWFRGTFVEDLAFIGIQPCPECVR